MKTTKGIKLRLRDFSSYILGYYHAKFDHLKSAH